MSVADQVLERQERERVEAIAELVKPGKEPSLWYCEDCLVAIPEARRLAAPGCTRCVACQQMHEQRRRA